MRCWEDTQEVREEADGRWAWGHGHAAGSWPSGAHTPALRPLELELRVSLSEAPIPLV